MASERQHRRIIRQRLAQSPKRPLTRWQGYTPQNLGKVSTNSNQIIGSITGNSGMVVGEPTLTVGGGNGAKIFKQESGVTNWRIQGDQEKCCITFFSHLYRASDNEMDFFITQCGETKQIATIQDPYLDLPAPKYSEFGRVYNNTDHEPSGTKASNVIVNAGANVSSCKQNDWCCLYAPACRVNNSSLVTAYFITSDGVKTYEYPMRTGARLAKLRAYGSELLIQDYLQLNPNNNTGNSLFTTYNKNGDIVNQVSMSARSSSNLLFPDIGCGVYPDHNITSPPWGIYSSEQDTAVTDGKGNEFIYLHHLVGAEYISFVALNDHAVSTWLYGTHYRLLFDGIDPFGGTHVITDFMDRLNLVGNTLYVTDLNNKVYCKKLTEQGPGDYIGNGDDLISINGYSFRRTNSQGVLMAIDPLPTWDYWGQWREKNCKCTTEGVTIPGAIFATKAVISKV